MVICDLFHDLGYLGCLHRNLELLYIQEREFCMDLFYIEFCILRLFHYIQLRIQQCKKRWNGDGYELDKI